MTEALAKAIAEGAERGREVYDLAEDELRACSLIDETGFAHQNDVLALLHGNLGRREFAGIFAVDIDVRSAGSAGDRKRRHTLREAACYGNFAARCYGDRACVRGIAGFAERYGVLSRG